ncbi:MAG: NADH-ubiquinone oxidoreductase-F iron-sulfur binding region domain-containing protein [Desulfuromonadales bacterium]|nr:NADH-ubiquinone oxidoreductase-F iron-sulfur binding region domain-containing protein [Desulfuromonadales bacterium]
MTAEELLEKAEQLRQRQQATALRLLLCCSSPCLSCGAGAVKAALAAAAADCEPSIAIEVAATGCLGPCSRGPLLCLQRPGEADVVFERVTPDDARAIFAAALAGLLPDAQRLPADLPFLAGQTRIVLENCGRIDPENIEHALAAGGYAALARALSDFTPAQVCDQVLQSGLRGRGGGGYPTGLKWQLLHKARGDRKFVVANGDEGDPGAYMDRALMESDPHRIIEGMAIAGYATGASQGYVYVRGEYPLAARRIRKAIRDAERLGLLGMRILDSPFSFRIDLRLGAGAFVCGEETALMASIMGRRGQPVPRPPYPAERGLWGAPTVINNVETFGNIPPILRDGPERLAALGTGKSRGTKIFALCGDVVENGLIEVPMGTSLREVVYRIGGGLAGDVAFKAAQTGGPSGGCIPAEHLDISLDYETLRELGSIMGSGGLIIMGERTCMVDVARYFMEFCMDESCGKCSPCRAGTVQMYRLLDRICNGSARERDLKHLEQLCRLLPEASLCGLGLAAANPVLSTLSWFRDEYLEHIRAHRCPAGTCRMSELPPIMMADELLQRIAAGRLNGEAF